MKTEKIWDKLKTSPNQKESPEKKDTLEAKKQCLIETRRKLTKIQLDNLKDEIWYRIKLWENIWRIIYEYAKKNWKKPIPTRKLEGINVVPWDKVYFSENEVIIKYLKWWTKKIPFEKSDNCWSEEKIHPQKENKSSFSLEREIKLWEINEKNPELKKEAPEQYKSTQTIFDKYSPLLWDRIAYKNEMKIRKAYWDKIRDIINKYCQWSLIDENFLYWVFARESRFDVKAVSNKWVRWLGQLTEDTILSIASINESKAKKYKKQSDFYISNEIRTWIKSENNKGWYYKVNQEKALLPINQIKLTISYLLYLENLFSDVKNKDFKTELIITSYNLWPGKTKKIYDGYKWLENWEWLKKALEMEHKKWEISKGKLKEVVEYVPKVKEYIKLASLSNRKVA